MNQWSILVHGGAGDSPVSLDQIEGCERAADAAAAILDAGGTALDAVEHAVRMLEDWPLLNAGTGACLNEDGAIELDASIMAGDLRGGAVAALPPFKNPIAIARRVMENTRHILLAGEGAARFARDEGFEPVPLSALVTEGQQRKWEAAKKKPSAHGGTVGAVAKDRHGHVAAATSTGGMVDKRVGRVGDSAILGAGTFADDELGACSTTGHGEAMMRVGLARYAVEGLRNGDTELAAKGALAMLRSRTDGTGGVIVVGKDGSVARARTTLSMSWAAVVDGTRTSGS